MYKAIKKHPSTRDLYAHRLITEGILTESEDAALQEDYRNSLDRGEPLVSSLVMEPQQTVVCRLDPLPWATPGRPDCDTSVPLSRLKSVAEKSK